MKREIYVLFKTIVEKSLMLFFHNNTKASLFLSKSSSLFQNVFRVLYFGKSEFILACLHSAGPIEGYSLCLLVVTLRGGSLRFHFFEIKWALIFMEAVF